MAFREVSRTSDSHEYPAVFSGRPNALTPSTNNLILSGLPSDMSRLLKPSLKPVVLCKEQFLYQEEDRLEYVYFPETAVVSEFKTLEDGRMVEIAVTGREGAIGFSSMFSDSHFAPNCTQVSQVGTAQRVDAETFDKLLRSRNCVRANL